MKIYEFGRENADKLVLLHPSLVTWDYFEYVIPLLEKDFHLLIPALPGYDLTDEPEFSSVEQIASELAGELLQREITEVKAQHFVMDGGITPYQLPWILTRFAALRDFGMMALGKLGGEKLIIKAFSSTQYNEEDLQYIANIFRHCTYKTLWNTFDSCNNYKMPRKIMSFSGTVHYWYAAKERKARDWDLKYMKKFIPSTVFKCFEEMDHGDMAIFYPERMAQEIRAL